MNQAANKKNDVLSKAIRFSVVKSTLLANFAEVWHRSSAAA